MSAQIHTKSDRIISPRVPPFLPASEAKSKESCASRAARAVRNVSWVLSALAGITASVSAGM